MIERLSQKGGVARCFALLVAAAVVLAARSASARDDVTGCAEGSAEVEEAQERLDRLGDSIAVLGPSSDPASALLALRSLLASPCFALASRDEPQFRLPTSALSLKAWWNAGGSVWVGSYVHPAYGEGTAAGIRSVFQTAFPPSARVAVTRDEGSPRDLASVLCPADAGDCGADTVGWLQRAEWSLRRRASPSEDPRLPWWWVTTPFSLGDDCAGGHVPSDYAKWRSCLREKTPLGTAPPLGRFKAPRIGWFVVLGLRRQDDACRSCDEVRAYSLATGDVVIAHRCRCADFMHGDDYVCPLERAGRGQSAITKGSVNVENLREAALLLMLVPHMQDEFAPTLAPFGFQTASSGHGGRRRPREGNACSFGVSATLTA